MDIIAYVLSFNGFPAGERELPSQTAMMNTIRIDAEKQDDIVSSRVA